MLTFAYACPVKYGNPMGNRISKTVTDMTGKKAPFTTYYTRDAQGNTMAVYDNSSLKSDIAICELDRPYLEQISRNIITYKAKSLIAEEDDFYHNSINEYISQNWQGDSCKYKYMSLISEKNIPCFIEQEDYNIIEQLYYQDFGYFQSVETPERKSYLSQKYNEHYENMGDRTYCFIQELSIAMEQPIDAFEAWLMHQKRTDLRSKLDVFYTELAQISIYYGILNDTAYQDSLYWKEQHLYGSSRLGIAKPELEVTNYTPSNASSLTTNFRNYELTNHLGNAESPESLRFGILSTIKDEKQQIDQNADGIVDYYEPIVITANDYYPFGMLMPNRSFSLAGSNYRFGFGGMEKDNEIKGDGNSIAYEARFYDPRLGRWLSLDPLQAKYPGMSPYNFTANNPIIFKDVDGRDFIIAFQGGFQTSGASQISVADAGNTGALVANAQQAASQNNITLKSAIYANGVSSNDAVNSAFDFIKANHTTGEKIMIYGYSWGGDGAVELSKKLQDGGYNVDLLITVDASDGPLKGSTVDRDIPSNVKVNVNEYQTDHSPMASRGDINVAEEGNSSSKIFNIQTNSIDDKIHHGNIDEATLDYNSRLISNTMGIKSNAPVPTIKVPNGQNDGSSKSSSRSSTNSSSSSSSGSSFRNSSSGSSGSSSSSQGSSERKTP